MNDADVTQDQNDQTEAEQPRRSRRSRRATRPAGTPERPTLDVLAELGLEESAPVTGADAPVESEIELPERSEPAAARETSAVEESAVVDDAPSEPAAEQDAAEPDVEEDAADEEPTAETDDDEAVAEPIAAADEDDDESPRLPAAALLFQAPDLTPRRRRRASSPAGPPVADAEDETPAPQASPETEPAAESTDEAPKGRSRRGRRSKTKTTEETPESAPQETPAVDDQAPEDTDAVENTDATENGAEDDGDESAAPRRRRRRGGRGRRKGKTAGEQTDEDVAEGDATEESTGDDSGEFAETASDDAEDSGEGGGSRRRRRRRSRSGRDEGARARDEVTALKGSTRLEAKRQRRREGRDANRRRSIITEAEFLARREAVDRAMVVRERDGRTQIAVLEDDVLVEHFVARKTQTSMVGNVYLGRVQNVLPSMEAAFVDLGRGRNAVLYAGEVNWDAAGLEGQPRRIEQALSSGDSVLVQVTKDPIGHKGARLTSQITLAGRYLVLVPSGAMTGISRKLPDTERNRLKKLLKEIVPEGSGVIVRTAAEGASEEELRRDVERLTKTWADIEKKVKKTSTSAPVLLKGEPELATRVVRDVFNEDFRSLTVQGDEAWATISDYVGSVAPDLAERLHHWTDKQDVFAAHRIDEQLAKGMDRKVWLPSGGSLIIDRTEAMTVVDVNTGKFTGSGGTLEETVTRNNLEASEEIVRQLRLRDIGGIIVVDFIDMVLESNRDLVLRRLVECLGRDRTRHQVAEVTSLGLVQMTRKRVGQGLVEAFSTTCEHCHGRGIVMHEEPVESGNGATSDDDDTPRSGRGGRGRGRRSSGGSAAAATPAPAVEAPADPAQRAQVRATLAAIAAAAAHAHEEHHLDAEGRPTPPLTEDVLDIVLESDGVETDPAVVVAEVVEEVEIEAVVVEDAVVEDAEPAGDTIEIVIPEDESPESTTGDAVEVENADATDVESADAVTTVVEPVEAEQVTAEAPPSEPAVATEVLETEAVETPQHEDEQQPE